MSRHAARIKRIRKRLTPNVGPDGIDYSKPISDADMDLIAVLEAYVRMKADMPPRNQSRGGVPVVPVDRAEAFYGPEYTQQEFRILAIHEALLERGYNEDYIDTHVPEYLEVLEDFLGGSATTI
jgi:hypothetical protein